MDRMQPGTFYILKNRPMAVREEKKSRFIGRAFSIATETEAEAILAALRKEEYAASHHCYAYLLRAAVPIEKCSDDGEPSKTAGQPILSVVKASGMTNLLLVVTRYFGGTLLGTGGLTHAYADTAKDTLASAVRETVIPSVRMTVITDYRDNENLQRFFLRDNITVSRVSYAETVETELFVFREKAEETKKRITDLSQNRAILSEETECLAIYGERTARVYTEQERQI